MEQNVNTSLIICKTIQHVKRWFGIIRVTRSSNISWHLKYCLIGPWTKIMAFLRDARTFSGIEYLNFHVRSTSNWRWSEGLCCLILCLQVWFITASVGIVTLLWHDKTEVNSVYYWYIFMIPDQLWYIMDQNCLATISMLSLSFLFQSSSCTLWYVYHFSAAVYFAAISQWTRIIRFKLMGLWTILSALLFDIQLTQIFAMCSNGFHTKGTPYFLCSWVLKGTYDQNILSVAATSIWSSK